MPILYSFQRDSILSAFSSKGIYHPGWSYIDQTDSERLAYEFVVQIMHERDLDTKGNPPVWAWLTTADRLHDLAEDLFTPDQKQTYQYITLTLDVPDEMIMRSSYYHWCDLYFNGVKARHMKGDDNWLDWKSVDHEAGDVVQATLPFLKRDWIIDYRMLTFDNGLIPEAEYLEVAPVDQTAGPARQRSIRR